MIKVVCIDNHGCDLTIGKTYDVVRFHKGGGYVVINDRDIETWYWSEWFKTLSEIRNEKIERLLR